MYLEAFHHQPSKKNYNDSSNGSEHLLCLLGTKCCAEHFTCTLTPNSIHFPTWAGITMLLFKFTEEDTEAQRGKASCLK